jgi:hypothetical protein
MEHSERLLATSRAEPRRPGWLRLVFFAFVSAFVARVAVLLALWTTTLLKLVPDGALTDDARCWPWRTADAWANAADLGLVVLVAVPLALLLRLQVRAWNARSDMRLWPVVLAYACAAPLQSTVAPVVFVVIAVRTLALRPATPSSERRLTHRVAAVPLVLAAAALLTATFAYQPFHPLRVGFPGGDDPLDSFNLDRTGIRLRTLAFEMKNDGPQAVTLRSARVIGRNTSRAVVRIGEPIAGAVLSRGDLAFGTIELPRAVCRNPKTRGARVIVDGLAVQLHTLGKDRTQRFGIGLSQQLRCY